MDTTSGYRVAACGRLQSLGVRLAFAGVIAAFGLALTNSMWPAIWFAAALCSQSLDAAMLRAVTKSGAIIGARRKAFCTAAVGASACIYSAIAPVLWFAGGEPGKLMAMLFICGALLHVTVYAYHSRVLLTATALPHAVQFFALPLLALWRGELGPMHALGLVFGAGLFVTHLALSVRENARITDGLKKATAESRAGEESMRMLFAGNPVGMWLLEPVTMRILDSNAAAARQFGYSCDQLLTMTAYDLLHPDDVEAARRENERNQVHDYDSDRHWRMIHANGTELKISPICVVIQHNGAPAMLSGLIDFTQQDAARAELVAAADALANARDEAEAANRAKSAFLANMSHEIRTPLNGVLGVADVLSKTKLDPRQAEMLDMIRSSGQTLERLLSDVLDLARIESGQVEIRNEPFDLYETVSSASALMQMQAEDKGVGYFCSILPQIETHVLGDAVRVKQIITNLLSNAVKFTEAGEVRLDVNPAEGGFEFVVRDTGVGFGREEKEKLFQRFQQADGSITRRFGGSGLGLAITRQLVELMNGRIACESAPGQGSTFTVWLPLQPCAGSEQSEKPTPTLAARPLRVLVADDHPINRKVVELILSHAGADLVSVGDGAEALEAFREGGFDAVLMDMQMPVMDGLSATRGIRKLEAETGLSPTPVIMVTANAMPEHIRSALGAGANLHLCKPISAEALLSALAQVTSKTEAVAAA